MSTLGLFQGLRRPVRGRSRRGFTLVELLVVVIIIATLVALLLPAVQAAREAGRCATCTNNLRQMAQGYLQHEAAKGFYPTGGWGWGWVGDADMGSDYHQGGGWMYNILPYIDQLNVHDLGKGADPTTKLTQHCIRVTTPLTLMACPTRRRAVLHLWWSYAPHGKGNHAWPDPSMSARSDYASSGGDKNTHPGTLGLWPTHCGNGDCGPPAQPPQIPDEATFAALRQKIANYGPTGMDYPLSMLTSANMPDGASYIYMLGEKYLNPQRSYTGECLGDNETLYCGHNADISRWSNYTPAMDQPGYDDFMGFGSAHPSGFNMAFADGAVKKMSFFIDPTVHRQLGNRKDGKPTNLSGIF